MITSLVSFVLLALLCVIVIFSSNDYDSCYNERESEGIAVFGNCCGLVGGTSATEYLSEMCIGCPYFTMVNAKKGESNDKEKPNSKQ